jgi:hypothetical protein
MIVQKGATMTTRASGTFEVHLEPQALHRRKECIRLQQIASYHLGPALAQRFGSLRLAHQDANGIAAIEQARLAEQIHTFENIE